MMADIRQVSLTLLNKEDTGHHIPLKHFLPINISYYHYLIT